MHTPHIENPNVKLAKTFEVTLPGLFEGNALDAMLEGLDINNVRYETPGWDRGGFDEEQTTTFFFNNEADAVKFKLRWV